MLGKAHKFIEIDGVASTMAHIETYLNTNSNTEEKINMECIGD